MLSAEQPARCSSLRDFRHYCFPHRRKYLAFGFSTVLVVGQHKLHCLLQPAYSFAVNIRFLWVTTMSTIRRIDDGDYIDIQQQLDNENNRRSSATASQQSTTSTFVSTPSDTLDGFRESKYELKEEYIESRAESREEIQHMSTRAPLARMSRLRSLGDLYAESPEITPLATPSQPWTLGSGRNSVNSSFTTPTPLVCLHSGTPATLLLTIP